MSGSFFDHGADQGADLRADPVLARGGLIARFARDAGDLAQITALRAVAFPQLGPEADPFDEDCQQLMITGGEGLLVATLRLRQFTSATEAAAASYSSGFYDLRPLSGLPGGGIEIGRLCLLPQAPRAWEGLRLAWAALMRLAEGFEAGWIIGCASFPGADPARHQGALAALVEGGKIGPPALRPARLSGEICDYPKLCAGMPGDPAALPPVLRFYLSLGAWVSDHAVIDRRLDTLHVFTCVERARLPEARGRALQAMAGS